MLTDTTERLIRTYMVDPIPQDPNEGPLISFDQLDAMYQAAGGSVERTVASALRTIAASEALVSKKITTQDLSTDGPAVSAELRALAREWDAKADALEAAATDTGFIGYVPGPGGHTGRYEGEEVRSWWG